MGKDCLQTFLNLNISVEDRYNVEACMTTLENYFKPQRNVVYERYVFNSCEQNQGESVDSYVTCLRKFASSCKFGTLTDELIHDIEWSNENLLEMSSLEEESIEPPRKVARLDKVATIMKSLVNLPVTWPLNICFQMLLLQFHSRDN